MGSEGVPVRVHDQCLTSEVLGSLRCDCKQQLELALDHINEHGGCVIYMQQARLRDPNTAEKPVLCFSLLVRAVCAVSVVGENMATSRHALAESEFDLGWMVGDSE